MGSYFAFWAKLGDNTWPEEYHPVLCHLIDVAQVALQLWETAFRSKVRQLVAERLGLPVEATGKWLAFWAGAHDIGKITPCFQQERFGRAYYLVSRLRSNGFEFAIGNEHHGKTGTAVLAAELANFCKSTPPGNNYVQSVAVAVGGHHGVFPANWFGMTGLGNEPWANARREVLKELSRLLQVGNCPQPNPTQTGDQSVWMFLAGLTSVADWIGSNVEFFKPYGNPDVAKNGLDIDAYFRESEERARRALAELGWLDRPVPTGTPVTFQEATGIKTPRPLQTKIVELAESMTEPGLIIVEAPMGEGKTEAAWYVADCWERRGGQGAYVALPTMATSNQMVERVGKFLHHAPGKKNLMLQHGKAALNKKFDELKKLAEMYDDDDKKPSAVVAEAWFAANKKHGLLAPYGVGTIDQALLAVLQTKHVFVRLFGLAGKCVILDEVHAYDAYMTTLMERLLRWLAALGCPVVLLSATLPKEKRLKLLSAYAGTEVTEPEEKPYPRITTVPVGGEANVEHVDADPDRARTVHLDWLGEATLADRLKEALGEDGCAAVIRNTVGMAQETYLQLKRELPADCTVELFHARFPFGRRQEIENGVLERFGKGLDGRAYNPKRPPKAVLVATQVIEQSLDLDFDVMVSDVAPVDLILQRAGRMHRHDRGARPAGCAQPRLWLIEPKNKEGVPEFGKSEYVYARFVLLRSFVALKSVCAIHLPGDLERFVEQVYGVEPLSIPDDWQAETTEAKRKMVQEHRRQKQNAKGVMIYAPDAEDLLQQPNLRLEEDNPEAAARIRAATRDTEPTVQLIVVYHIDGSDFLNANGTEPFDPEHQPDFAQIRRLLDNELSISRGDCAAFYGKRDVPTGWLKCGMLRHHRVVTVDSNGKSMDEFPLFVDVDVGVSWKDFL